jgi:hypothetical protein
VSEQPPAPPAGPSTQPPPPPMPGPAPTWVTAAPPPMSRRRKILFAIVGGLVVAIVAAVLALDAVIGSLTSSPLGSGQVGAAGAELPGCDEFYDGFSERSRQDLEAFYGENLGSVLEDTGVPDGFPASSFAWSGIVPACGSAIVNPQGETNYLYYAQDVSRTRFDGLAAMLAATGNVMTVDDVPREPQGLDPEEFTGVDAGTRHNLYREFVVPDVGTIGLTFETDDVLSTSGTGELLIEFNPGS